MGLSILLTILKIIGIVFLVLVSVIFLILLLVLFCPFQYQLQGEKLEAIGGKGEVRWLFGLLCVGGEFFENTGMKAYGKLFGFSVFGEGKKKRKKRKKEKPAINKEGNVAEISARSKEIERKPEVPKEATAASLAKEEKKREEKVEEKIFDASVIEKNTPADSVEQKVSIPRRVKLSTVIEVPEESDEIKIDTRQEESKEQEKEQTKRKKKEQKNLEDEREQAIPLWKQYMDMPEKKKLMKACIRLIRRMGKGILPKNFYLQGTIGTGDPAYTGCLLAVAGVAKAKFGDNLNIKGNFAAMALDDIVFRVKGRIVIGGILFSLLRFLLTKPVWSYIRVYWKGSR